MKLHSVMQGTGHTVPETKKMSEIDRSLLLYTSFMSQLVGKDAAFQYFLKKRDKYVLLHLSGRVSSSLASMANSKYPD